MKNNLDEFNVLRKIQSKLSDTEELAKDLGFSLGKLNYCLKVLHSKGLVKIENFRKKEKNFHILRNTFLRQKELILELN